MLDGYKTADFVRNNDYVLLKKVYHIKSVIRINIQQKIAYTLT